MQTSTVYLDHNILDALVKGKIRHPPAICQNPIYVYSSETLKEIMRSIGREDDFLNQLFLIDAQHILVESTIHGGLTGRWRIESVDPHLMFDSLKITLAESPTSDFGMISLLQKMYGGLPDTSFAEISKNAHLDVVAMLDGALKDAESDVPEELLEPLRKQAEQLKTELQNSFPTLSALDTQPAGREPDVQNWEREVGAGPKQFNNLKPPHIINQIWAQFQGSVGSHSTLEQLFGLDMERLGLPSPKTITGQCNALYHALNYFGYHRDSGMKKERRLVASNSDLTHVGYAAHCDYLLSADSGMIKKAKAVYEYLGVQTNAHHFSVET